MSVVLSALAFLLGIFGLVHHFLITCRWFDWESMYHHEPLIAMCFVAGASLLAGGFLRRRK